MEPDEVLTDEPNKPELPQPEVVTAARLQQIKEHWLEYQSKHLEHLVGVFAQGVAMPLLQPIMQGYISLILTIEDRDATIEALRTEVQSLQNKLLLTI